MAKNEPAKFNIFSRAFRDGKGAVAEDPIMDKPSFGNFFKLFKRKFNQIVTMNLFFVAGNFPLLALLGVMAGFFSTDSTAPVHTVFAQFNGVMTHTQNAFVAANLGSMSTQTQIRVMSTGDWILIGIACLAIFTFGPVMTGMSYIFRNMVKEDPIFIKHDFFYAIKRNLKQSIIYGIIDVAVMFFIFYDIVFFNLNYSAGALTSLFFFASLCLAVIYFFMRMYVYVMMVTFDLSIGKLLKNALYFSVLGIKRNSCCILGTIVIIALNLFLVRVFLPIGLMLPFVITVSLLVFLSVYCAYPVICKYMIEPYYDKDGNPKKTEAQ